MKVTELMEGANMERGGAIETDELSYSAHLVQHAVISVNLRNHVCSMVL